MSDFKVEVLETVPEGYLYFLFDKPLQGLTFDFSKPGSNALITNIDYEEEEEEEQEPLTIEFSL